MKEIRKLEGIFEMTSTIVALLLLPVFLSVQATSQKNSFEDLSYFVGSWEGTGKGQPGISTTERSYKLVLSSKFLQIQNRSIYAPQDRNPRGETHEDWGLISFDQARKKFVFRQFHGEGFVSQYVLISQSPDKKKFIFETEHIENIPAGWRARESLTIIGPDEFVEVFELAAPGKEFELYSENRYKRKH